jgi:hypothetical protein
MEAKVPYAGKEESMRKHKCVYDMDGGPCRICGVTFVEKASQKCACGKPGTMRVHNRLKAGVHCDACWEKLVTECTQRSW